MKDVILEEMQSKLRCFSEHPCCVCPVLDFTPNAQAFSIRLRTIDNTIHTCKPKEMLLNALTVFCLTSAQPQRCFPLICKGYFQVSQLKTDTVQEFHLFGPIGIAAFLHRVLVGPEVTTVN